MNDQKALQAFLNLISFDKKIHDARELIEKENSEITGYNEKLSGLEVELTQAQNFLTPIEKAVHTIESSMKELGEQEKTKQALLPETTSNKEYQSLKREIDFLKKQQHELEDSLIDAWKKLERAQKQLDETKQSVETRQQDIVQERTIHEDSYNKAQALLHELNDQRRPQETGIPEEWLERYNVMQMINAEPIAFVEENTCNACFYPLTAQDIVDLNRKKLIQCRQCYRFLCRKEDLL